MPEPTVTNIAIVCSRLDLPGGIERAIVNTANLFYKKGHRVSLIILDESQDSFYPVASGINMVHHPLHFGITDKGNRITRKISFLFQIGKLRSILNRIRPDVIITTDYVFTIATFFAVPANRKRIFSWEHHQFFWLKRSSFWQMLYRRIYPRIGTVICLNQTEAFYFKAMGCNTAVIPNFIEEDYSKKASLDRKTILTVGWLIKRKGVDLIPEVAKTVFDQYPDWNWRIIGTGPEEEKLKEELNRMGLENRVEIIRPQDPQLEEHYLSASVYVMLSRSECFPMVLLEAMSHGVPPVAFDCPTGPKDIINHPTDGLLIPNEDIRTLSNGISQLIRDESLRKKLGDAAYRNIRRFSSEKIYELWKELLKKE